MRCAVVWWGAGFVWSWIFLKLDLSGAGEARRRGAREQEVKAELGWRAWM